MLTIKELKTVQNIVADWQSGLSANTDISERDRPLYVNLSSYMLDLLRHLGLPGRGSFIIREQLLDAAIEWALSASCDEREFPSHLVENSPFLFTPIKTQCVAKALKQRSLRGLSRGCLLNEALMLKSLRPHPHVVQLLAISSSPEGELKLVLPFYRLGDLHERSTQGNRLSSQQIIAYVIPIASAIEFLHQEQVVHRDIKPSNVFLGSDDNPRLGDLEFALRLKGGQPEKAQLQGTAAYMPPEYGTTPTSPQEVMVEPKADVWPFGLLLLVMLDRGKYLAALQKDGQPPRYKDMYQAFAPQSPIFREKLQEEIEMQTGTLSQQQYKVLKEVLQGSLKIDPEERSSMSEICKKLEALKV